MSRHLRSTLTKGHQQHNSQRLPLHYLYMISTFKHCITLWMMKVRGWFWSCGLLVVLSRNLCSCQSHLVHQWPKFTVHVIYTTYSFSALKSSTTFVSCKIRSILELCWLFDPQQIKQTWTSTFKSASVAETLSSNLVTLGPQIQGQSWRSTSA